MYYGTNGRYYFRYCGNYIDFRNVIYYSYGYSCGINILYGIDAFTTKENEELT